MAAILLHKLSKKYYTFTNKFFAKPSDSYIPP